MMQRGPSIEQKILGTFSDYKFKYSPNQSLYLLVPKTAFTTRAFLYHLICFTIPSNARAKYILNTHLPRTNPIGLGRH